MESTDNPFPVEDVIRSINGYWYIDESACAHGSQRHSHSSANLHQPKAVSVENSNMTTSIDERHTALTSLTAQIKKCVLCKLSQGRTHAVPGVGVLDPLVMVIGEAPGANEDAQGEPFVGRAGRYLDKWLASIDLYRSKNAYIANIIKCRPPNNRDPLADEITSCTPYLIRQIEIIKPKTILAVGRISGQHLLKENMTLGAMRARQHSFMGIPLFVTYHPSAVLRNPQWRAPVWEDLQRVRDFINLSNSG